MASNEEVTPEGYVEDDQQEYRTEMYGDGLWCQRDSVVSLGSLVFPSGKVRLPSFSLILPQCDYIINT